MTVFDETGSSGIVAGSPTNSPSVVRDETSTSGSVNGGAALSTEISTNIASGGSVDGGTALSTETSTNIASGGSIAGGNGLPAKITTDVASGGSVDGGTALSTEISTNIASGGSVAGGNGLPAKITTDVASGGSVDGGTSIVSLGYSPRGGAKTNGSGVNNIVANPKGTRGAVVGGLNRNTIYINSIHPSGGVELSGSVRMFIEYNPETSGGAGGGKVRGRNLLNEVDETPEPKVGFVCKREDRARKVASLYSGQQHGSRIGLSSFQVPGTALVASVTVCTQQLDVLRLRNKKRTTMIPFSV